MTPVKLEPGAGPSTPSSLSARLAKYAYSPNTPTATTSASPSRSRISQTRPDGVKVEPVNAGSSSRTRASPYFAPVIVKSENGEVAEDDRARTAPGRSFGLDGSQRRSVGTGTTTPTRDSSTDRESPDSPMGLRRSTRTITPRLFFEPVSDRMFGHEEGDDAENELSGATDGMTRRQKRIRSTRASRAQARQAGLPGPSSAQITTTTRTIGTPTSAGRRRRARADSSTSSLSSLSSDDDDVDIPPAPPLPTRHGLANANGNGNGRKRPRAYAAPETYAHMRPLPDILAPDLDVLFCGINPGMKSSKTGHHFSHPTNKFWRSLHYSGMTSRLVPTIEDHLLPTEFNYGLTVLVDRPTAEQSELSTLEMRLNALPFTEKLLRVKPKIVCFVGKKIWDVYESVIRKTATTSTIAVSSETAAPDPGPSGGTNGQEALVKIEKDSIPTPPITPIKTEPDPDARLTSSTPRPPTTSTNGRNRREKVEKTPFDWTQPRSFRLPHVQEGQATDYTYFWVVPNTSGLERTPLAEQIALFGKLNKFKDEIKAGRIPPLRYKEFDLEGVRTTVEAMRIAAEAKEQASAS